MYLQAIATAVPPTSFTQAQCWELGRDSLERLGLSRRSALILRSVLTGDSGIEKRHFCVADIPNVFGYTADELHHAYRREAPLLAANALEKALAQAGRRADEIDALLVCTCTGYLCPGVTSYVAEQLGLRTDAFLQDLVGLGCGAAIPMLRAANGVLAADPEALVACVAVEVCSAAFYVDDDLGVLLSACLFGDGAAASLWEAKGSSDALRCGHFSTLHIPAERDRLRFEQRGGKLRNLLHPTVPNLAAQAVDNLFAAERARVGAAPIERVLAHSGGREVIAEVSKVLPPEYPLAETRSVLRDYGNMSSPSVLFALAEAMKGGRPEKGDWWLVSFGAGFSAHGCRIMRSTA
ncbi:MAG: 3-oxoacyl-[acyl-carrier-protein] synthase III C-terminal domain-containing protein [Nibricoccus sp.]